MILLLAAVPGTAGAAQADMIVQRIDAAERVVLTSERARWAKPENDLGPVPRELPMAHLSLVLNRSPQNQQAWETLLRDQKDPATANHHQWLAPTEIGDRFGASQHDIDALTSWLRTQGLAVDAVANSRTRITFSGRAGDVAKAFATELHFFQTGTGKRMANVADVHLPRALARSVRSVIGLRTIRFKPLSRVETRTQSLVGHAFAQPQATHCANGVCSHVIFPADFAKIYDLVPVQQQGIDGSGQSIAIVGRARVLDADVTNFQNRAKLATKLPTTIIPPTGTDPGAAVATCSDADTTLPSCKNPTEQVKDQGEATLDVERAGSVAPGATIKLIASGNVGANRDGVFIATEYAIDTDPVPANVISISFGTCEADASANDAAYIDDLFGQAAMEGISVFVSSGDGGVAGCASLDSAPLPNERISTSLLCASGYATCVGGTQFADSTDTTAYWSESNGVGYESAYGYIPEGSWNEPVDKNGAPQIAASGGGTSVYIATPAWQVGPGVPGRQGRYTPDVSFPAATSEGYFTCTAAQGGSCVVTSGSFGFLVAGGTSASAPSMAGVAALLNQQTGSAQGNLNPRLYALAGNPANGVFHDVTIASSGVTDCNVTIPSLCNNSTPGPSGLNGGLSGYTVGPGYDLATGLGSIDVANLLTQWSNPYAASVNLDQHGLSGAWYNPATSGQGLVLEIGRDAHGAGVGELFGGWFTYDASNAGSPRWYSIQGPVNANAPSATLPIYATLGGRFDASQNPTTTSVGQATLTFSDCTHGTLGYTFSDGSGRSGSIPLTRLTTNPDCSQDGHSSVFDPDSALSGAWYKSSTSGQGFVFDLSPVQNVLFGAWYTFAPNAAPSAGAGGQRWYTLQAPLGADARTTDNIGIFASSDGVFDNPASVHTVQVGSARLVFTTCTTATLTYHFSSGENAGRSGSIDLTRLLAPLPECSL
ncbi:MAG: S53 family peptidase [Dokdonella sp.]